MLSVISTYNILYAMYYKLQCACVQNYVFDIIYKYFFSENKNNRTRW